jgi:flavin-dependent dehydrogenase
MYLGAGPAGLFAASKLKQFDNKLSACVVEKDSEVGAHIFSNAVFETAALEGLFPDWRNTGDPLTDAVKDDKNFFFNSLFILNIRNVPMVDILKVGMANEPVLCREADANGKHISIK